jgi:hypothetical protein
MTFWNGIVVLSDPDRLWRFFIPANVSNLVRFAQFWFLELCVIANCRFQMSRIHFLNPSILGGNFPMRDIESLLVTHRTESAIS